MYRKTLYGKEAREKVMAGINKIVDAVAVTLGINGRNVILAESAVIDYGVHAMPNRISKDGVTVCRFFDLNDEFERVGIMAVKEAAEKTVMQAGDGTTTTCVLLRSIASEGMKLIEQGANPMELKKGIDKAVDYVVSELQKMAIPVKGDIERIRQIATVSANNDESIGSMIAEAFEKIGEEGIIDLEASKSVKTEIKIADGLKFDKGWIHPLFANNREKQICEFENPFILLYEKRINHHTQVEKALQISMQKGRPLLIICEDADQEGLAFLAMNVSQGRVQCCLVTAPEFGEARRLAMEDIALVTGGTYLSDTKGTNIKNITEAHLGQAQKIIVSREETVIIDGKGNKVAIENQLNELRMNLAIAKDEDEKFPIEKRIAKLTGGVAVIHVGGTTETEMKERLDRFDDAVRATKAALSEGFISGAGTSFAKMPLPIVKENEYLAGYNVVFKALNTPLEQICKNSGVNDKMVFADVMKVEGVEHGYNAKTNKVENLLESGIIDPTKVLRCSLQNAASAASMILTAECVIVDSVNS